MWYIIISLSSLIILHTVTINAAQIIAQVAFVRLRYWGKLMITKAGWNNSICSIFFTESENPLRKVVLPIKDSVRWVTEGYLVDQSKYNSAFIVFVFEIFVHTNILYRFHRTSEWTFPLKTQNSKLDMIAILSSTRKKSKNICRSTISDR